MLPLYSSSLYPLLFTVALTSYSNIASLLAKLINQQKHQRNLTNKILSQISPSINPNIKSYNNLTIQKLLIARAKQRKKVILSLLNNQICLIMNPNEWLKKQKVTKVTQKRNRNYKSVVLIILTWKTTKLIKLNSIIICQQHPWQRINWLTCSNL